jgi:hypothetical protein
VDSPVCQEIKYYSNDRKNGSHPEYMQGVLYRVQDIKIIIQHRSQDQYQQNRADNTEPDLKYTAAEKKNINKV